MKPDMHDAKSRDSTRRAGPDGDAAFYYFNDPAQGATCCATLPTQTPLSAQPIQHTDAASASCPYVSHALVARLTTFPAWIHGIVAAAA